MRPRRIALTGTPGTGKSSVARALARRVDCVEVGELARRAGAAKGEDRSTTVDLGRLGRYLRAHRGLDGTEVVVGHLAHLLPIRDVVLLRCNPRVLEQRLARAHRGSPRERRENALAEAVDLILVEALERRRRIWEVDATRRTVTQVAREVEAIIGRRPRPRWGQVHWLTDPGVTAHLLPRPR